MALAIAEIMDIEYIWTSDSDSLVYPETIHQTMCTMAGDANVGGASTSLYIHNAKDTVVTQMTNGVYLTELYLARSFFGATSANDCQSGPCAAFRAVALPRILLKWYKQSVMGHWMVVNEDRHLTTRLMLDGWKTIFVSDVLTATETPRTLRGWLLQQVRWARAVHIETLHRPQVYLLQSPILFFGALRRQMSVFLIPLNVALYLLLGRPFYWKFTAIDIANRIIWTTFYLGLRNPYPAGKGSWIYILPAQIFYNIPLPAVQLWSLLTVTTDGWGTTMRAEKSPRVSLKTKAFDMGFFVLWLSMLGATLGRWVASWNDLATSQVLLCQGAAGILCLFGLGVWLVRLQY
ncbi:hypothetical protein LTR37_005471 [Vermiconidia calcicola]|uniref:Uncharacterized protein n=1 Tax=Vermiconidia calcicola TaxID=1690605 RepID=A0ACC3NJN9_9PEZI|nr:hypothetical protein LTR37_005471 [Vermiconidia calcicola]